MNNKIKYLFYGFLVGFFGNFIFLYGSGTCNFNYIPAEVVSYNDTCVFFSAEGGTVYSYNTENPELFPDTVPYLLDVDNKNTTYSTDDEILVVWRTCY